MTGQSHAASQASFGFDRSGVGLGERISQLARRLWPAKTAPNLASRTGKSIRAAELILSGTNGLSGDTLAELLRSDVGFEVLREVMSDGPRPSWWPDLETRVELASLERAQRAQQERIEALHVQLAR